MSNLQILNNSIRTLDNLFSLTDLHKASGGDEKHKPVLFLRLDQTKDLISEIQNDKVQICTLPVKQFVEEEILVHTLAKNSSYPMQCG